MANPQLPLKEKDNTHAEILDKYHQMVFADGALDTKTKLLVALALDTLARAQDGVSSLWDGAKKAGATDAEMLEAIRVAGFIGAAATIFPAMCAISEK
ncbi:MAG: carboxymuconolactone decarboxylase family protein [Deltaproteobacteria bacterium]|nr:carboxymuconolactone decarboxylase family protein [Deltaproteobacteria bacterium]